MPKAILGVAHAPMIERGSRSAVEGGVDEAASVIDSLGVSKGVLHYSERLSYLDAHVNRMVKQCAWMR